MGTSVLQKSHFSKLTYWASGAAIFIGFILSFVSYFKVCSSACNETHLWRYWGFHFETIGFVFFPALAIAHFASLHSTKLKVISTLFLAGAIGTEVMLIILQKFVIGHWCPVCLSIALSIGIATFLYAADFILNEDIMNKMWKGMGTIAVVAASFLFAFYGVAKEDTAKKAENSIRERIAFGKLESPIEVFIFTDWQCPACRGMEPTFVKLAPEIEKKARLTFADIDVHPETMNFIPYNLSFMVHNKDKYLQLRDILTEISIETKEPTEEMVNDAIKKLGIKYKPMHYSDISVASKYYKHLENQFDLDSTPTLVIVNLNDKKGKRFVGKEITPEAVLKAIDAMK